MPAPAKLSYILEFRQKIESAYGTFSSPALTDGVQLQFADRNLGAPIAYNAAYDGDLGPSHASLGTVLRAAPSGISAQASWPMRVKGAGAAYSASIVPNVHVFLLSSGFDGTLTATGGSEKWTYVMTPPGTAYGSHSIDAWGVGETHQLKGGISSFGLEFQNPGPPLATFDSRYYPHADPVDAARPSVTYALASVVPPLATSVALVMGSLTTNAVLYGGSVKFTREIDNPRVALSAAGAHLGFVPGGMIVEADLMLEKMAKTTTPFTAASAFDEYQLWKNATLLSACSLQFGSVQYNKYKIDFGARAQVIKFTPANESPIGKTTLTIRSSVSSPAASDAVTVTFD
jgi:hypothetical protein